MDVERFLSHHGITENPFGAEEARHDPVFERLTGRDGRSHPEFTKILGCVDRPQSSVVFGEKGSGKTALRLMMGKAVSEHNEGQPERRTLPSASGGARATARSLARVGAMVLDGGYWQGRQVVPEASRCQTGTSET